MRRAILPTLLSAALLVGCGGDGDAPAARPTGGTAGASAAGTGPRDAIRIAQFEYEPSPATVRAGRRIAVPNADAAPHTLTHAADEPAFDSGTIEGEATGAVTIERPGRYEIVCEIHPFMEGEISVVR